MFDASGNLEAFFFFAAWGRLWLLLLLGVHPFFLLHQPLQNATHALDAANRLGGRATALLTLDDMSIVTCGSTSW
jgi:hypothetical protein